MRETTPIVAYLVIAHERPEQVLALTRRILTLSPRAVVLIHWDAKAEQVDWAGSLPARAAAAAKSIAVEWGRWSLVEAELILIREARERWGPEWFVLISGVDWPVRDLSAWEREITAESLDAIIKSSPVLDRWAASPRAVPVQEDELRRTRDAWWVFRRPASPHIDRLVRGAVRRLSALASRSDRGPSIMDFYSRGYALTLRRQRPLPPPWKVHRGDQWLALRHSAVEVILSVDPVVTARFSRTLIPDESYIQTVIASTPTLRIANRPTTLAPWHAFARLPSLQLAPEDIPVLLRQQPAFVRKVGASAAAAVTALIDELVDAERR